MSKNLNKQQTPKTAGPKPAPGAAPHIPAKKTAAVKEQKTIHRLSLKLCIILAVISFTLYANTLQNGYVIDDVMVVQDNPVVKKGIISIPQLLSTPRLYGYGVDPNDFYRPLSMVMFAIECQFFGANPAVGHFFNIIVFIGCVIMLFLFLDKFFERKKTSIALIAALLFAIHPIHTEVVANIKSRDELLCYFFGFWSLNLFIDYMNAGKVSRLLMGAFALFLAFISKETVIAFLVIIPVLFFLYNNANKHRAFVITGAAVVTTIIFMVVRTAVLSKYHIDGAPMDFMENALVKAPSFGARLATEILVLGRYVKLMFIPYPLLCNYSFYSIPFVGFGNGEVLLSMALYLGLAYAGLTRLIKKKKDPWAFAIIFYLVTLSLFTNILFLIGAEMAERFVFFASTGFCLASALAMDRWVIKAGGEHIMVLKSAKVLAILVPVFLVFSGMTIARNSDWKSNATLYKTDLDKSPNDCRLNVWTAHTFEEEVYNNETDSVKKREIDDECIGYIRKALLSYPDFFEAHLELGRIYDRKHMYDSALVHDLIAVRITPNSSDANDNLGSVYISFKKYNEALELFRKALTFKPNYKLIYSNMALAYIHLSQYDSAIIYDNKIIELDAKNTQAYNDIATVYFFERRYDSAEVYYRKALALKPDYPDATFNLGVVYLNLNKIPEAIEQLKRTMTIDPKYINAYAYLGRVYISAQQYQAALDVLTKELKLDPNNGDIIKSIDLCNKNLGR